MNIISGIWYPQFGVVDADSPRFKAMVAYLRKNTGLPEPELIAEKMFGLGIPGPVDLVFTSNMGKTLAYGAVLTYVHPEVTLTEMQHDLGIPSIFVPFVDPVTVKPPVVVPKMKNPIGGPIPNTPRWYFGKDKDGYADGEIWPSPSGATFWKTTNIHWGPVWWQKTNSKK